MAASSIKSDSKWWLRGQGSGDDAVVSTAEIGNCAAAQQYVCPRAARDACKGRHIDVAMVLAMYTSGHVHAWLERSICNAGHAVNRKQYYCAAYTAQPHLTARAQQDLGALLTSQCHLYPADINASCRVNQ